ncbi:MAG: hypothetical protein ABI947_06600 [Chloroflexota bacterium]
MKKLTVVLIVVCVVLLNIDHFVQAHSSSLTPYQKTILSTPIPSPTILLTPTVVPSAPNIGRLIMTISCSHDGCVRFYQINTDGSDLVQPMGSSGGAIPEPSPNGEQYTYSNLRDPVICIQPTVGCTLKTPGLVPGFPVWLPDGQHIGFTNISTTKVLSTYIIKVQDGSLKQLPLPENSMFLSWSPDGSKMVFTRFASSIWSQPPAHLFISAADGSQISQLTTGNYVDSFAVWSPDSKQIAFIRQGEDRYKTTIHLVNSDGTNLHPLRGEAFNDSSPSWSPDGQYLVFIAQGKEIYIIHPDGTGLALVPAKVEAPHGIDFVVWIPNPSR